MKLQALEVAENISAAKPFRVDLRRICEFITQLKYCKIFFPIKSIQFVCDRTPTPRSRTSFFNHWGVVGERPAHMYLNTTCPYIVISCYKLAS